MSTRYMSFRTILLPLLGALTIGVGAATAQGQRPIAVATVPFAFQYGTHTFPAGTYKLSTISDSFLVVRGNHDAAVGLVMHGDLQKQPDRGKLVFQRSAEGYALRDVWSPAAGTHLICSKPKQHRQREMVEAKPLGPDVQVALLDVPR